MLCHLRLPHLVRVRFPDFELFAFPGCDRVGHDGAIRLRGYEPSVTCEQCAKTAIDVRVVDREGLPDLREVAVRNDSRVGFRAEVLPVGAGDGIAGPAWLDKEGLIRPGVIGGGVNTAIGLGRNVLPEP